MAYQVAWSPAAIADLVEIGEYIAKNSEFNARMVVSKIYDLAAGFGRHPRAATVVRELGNERFRQKLVYGWRVIYCIDDDAAAVVVLSVLHARRQFDSMQGRFWE